MRFPVILRPLAICLALVGAHAALGAGALTPLAVSANHRYLQDGNGRPFFLVGDCPQNLPLKLSIAEFDGYMAECATRGFNLLWVCIDGQRRAAATTLAPKDRQGNLMMKDGWDIATLNPAYFETIDAMLRSADRHGLFCLLTPLSECQWTKENISRNSLEKWQNYGRFLGQRYKGQANVLWHFGNDNLTETAQHPIVAGIKKAGDTHLMSVNWRPGYHKLGSAWVRKHEHGETWIDLDSWYCNAKVEQGGAPCYWQKLEYERSDPMPSFQCEAGYCPKAATITVDLSKFSGPIIARWFDPTNGVFTAIAGSPLTNTGSQQFTTPGPNIAGTEDWVLVLETLAETLR